MIADIDNEATLTVLTPTYESGRALRAPSNKTNK